MKRAETSVPRVGVSTLKHLLATGLAAGSSADEIAVEGPVYSGRCSIIFRATVPSLAAPVAVKCCIDPTTGAPDPLAASEQFSALQRVHAAMTADPSLRVPRPYLLAESAGVVVAEWISGPPMTDRLLSWHVGPKGARRMMESAGRWIRCFHGAHRLPDRALDVEHKLRGIALLERSSIASHDSVRDAISALRANAVRLEDVMLEQSWLHGDFKTDNLLTCSNGIVGIDVHARHENAVIYDLAAFANHLELTLHHPLALRLLPWRDGLINAFFDAFDRGNRLDCHLPYRWIALYKMIDSWSEFTGRDRSLRHRYLNACFNSAVIRMNMLLGEVSRGKP